MFVPSIKKNNMSSKMKIAENIRNRKSSSYNRSKDYTYFNIISDANEESNKSLLLSLGYNLYMNYFDKLLRTSDIYIQTKIQVMIINVISNLTNDEMKQLEIYEKTNEEIYEELVNYNNALLSNPSFTFYCKTIDVIGNQYLIISNIKDNYRLVPGKKYIFDLQDSSNIGTLLSFSDNKYSYKDVDGITIIGEPGYSGSYLIFTPSIFLNYSAAFIYNKLDKKKSSYYEFGYVFDKIVLELPSKKITSNISIPTTTASIDNFTGLNSETILLNLQYDGPKYTFTTDASYNSIISDVSSGSIASSYVYYVSNGEIITSDISKGTISGIQPALNTDIRFQFLFYRLFTENRKYGLYHGYYKFNCILTNNDSIALINGGKTSTGIDMNKLIQITSSDAIVETKYLGGLDQDGTMDGSYNFHSGTVTIRVLGDFESCSLYSSNYGYHKLEDILFFDKQYANLSSIKFEGYDDISGGEDGYLLCLHPESEIKFHDSSDNVGQQYFVTFNYNNNGEYDNITYNDVSANRYGLYQGQYVVKNVPESHPIAIINSGRETHIKYYGSDFFQTRLGPDEELYDFYYGSVIIEVFGDFGTVSIYDYHNGYCGGKNILIYSDVCIDFYSHFIDWYDIVESDLYDTAITYNTPDIDISFDTIYHVSSYINCSFNSNKILFDDISDNNTRYGFNTGNYVLLDVPQDYPIAFLNNGNEDLFYYDGYYPYKTREMGPDGNYYDFYYGNINIYVVGDFSQLSFVTLNGGVSEGGFRKIVFDEDNSTSYGEAIPHYGITSYYPLLQSSATDVPRDYQITVSVNIASSNTEGNYITFRMKGYDRNGSIDATENNPSLTFSVGDHVYFTFEHDNSEYVFGIFKKQTLITDELIITNNLNTTNSTILWYPNLAITNYYYYRTNGTNNFLNGSITVVNNIFDNIEINMVETSQQDGEENVSVLFSYFTFTFDLPIVIDESKKLYIYNTTTNSVEFEFYGSSLSISDLNTLIFDAGFTQYNVKSLEFDTSYSIIADIDLIQNIYYNNISSEIMTFSDISAYQFLTFSTEEYHGPTLISVNPDTGSIIDINGTIILEFDEQINYDYTKELLFTDTSSNSSTNFASSVQVSSAYMYINYNNLSYNTNYTIEFDSHGIVDLSNVQYNISDSSLNNYTITTVEDPRPTLQYYYPNDTLPIVYFDTQLSLIFSQSVYISTVDDITNDDTVIMTITNVDTSITFDNIDVSNQSDVARMSGNGTNTIHIVPIDDLLEDGSGSTFQITLSDIAIKNVNNNYYSNGSTDTISFTTSDVSGISVEELNQDTSASILSYNDSNYIVFNNNDSYNGRRYSLPIDASYSISNISQDHPFAILNTNISDSISYYVLDDTPIIIKISGGSENSDSNGDYFVFTDENDGGISIANGDFKLMRGRSYQFVNNGIDTNSVFSIHYNDTSETFSSDTSFVITIPTSQSTESGDIYYKYTSSDTYSTTTYDISVNISLLHKTVNETNENGNGDYDFYYGTVVIEVNNAFGSVSYYCFNHGYMGGQYTFTNFDDMSQ